MSSFLAKSLAFFKKKNTSIPDSAGSSSLVLPWPQMSCRSRPSYADNVIAYRCVTMIAQAAASIPWLVFEAGKEMEHHPLCHLLKNPNPLEDGISFLERTYGHLYLYGNAYLTITGMAQTNQELYALRPDRIRVLVGSQGWPEAYEYCVDGVLRTFSQHKKPIPSVLALKLLNPTHDHQGLSPFQAASASLDLHHATSQWSAHLFQNAAKPSGVLVCKGEDLALSDQQFERLKEQFERSYQGPDNAGRPLVLEGGLEWVSISHSPREMDHLNVRHAAAREIALAFGVPPMLLGIPGDNTFANYAEANRTFWHQTVLPLATKTAASVGQWLAPAFGKKLRIGCDLDTIDALSAERNALWDRVNHATFLSDEEKRQALGYGTFTEAQS